VKQAVWWSKLSSHPVCCFCHCNWWWQVPKEEEKTTAILIHFLGFDEDAHNLFATLNFFVFLLHHNNVIDGEEFPHYVVVMVEKGKISWMAVVTGYDPYGSLDPHIWKESMHLIAKHLRFLLNFYMKLERIDNKIVPDVTLESLCRWTKSHMIFVLQKLIKPIAEALMTGGDSDSNNKVNSISCEVDQHSYKKGREKYSARIFACWIDIKFATEFGMPLWENTIFWRSLHSM